MDANDIVLRYEALESERENLDGQFELIERFVLPGKGRFFEEGHDEEESIDWTHRELYDGTAQNALVLLASHIHGALTSPAYQWFSFRFRQDELNDNHEASTWLEECGERVMASIQDSNFNLEVNELYQDSGGYGTGVLLHDEQDGPPMEWNGHRFRAEMMRMCFFEEHFERRVAALFIKRSYSARELATKFGVDALPKEVAEKVEDDGRGTSKDEDLIHAIWLDLDKQDADTSKVLAVNARPYQSRYVLTNGRKFLGKQMGFYEFPGYVLRWQRTAGSKYGHSPGLIALGDVLTLQEMVKMVRTATEKRVDPPMKTTRKGVIGDLELQAGGVTQVRDLKELEPLLPPGAYQVEAGWQDINDLRQRVRQYFFVDQLELKESPTMTATEVQVRYEMMQRLLGPTLGRIQTDFLDPMLKNCFWMMHRKGALPPMPEVVAESQGELDIEYVGPLARSQKMATVDGIVRWLGNLAQMAQFPGAEQVLDVPDYDKIADFTGKTLGVPAELLRSQADRDEIRKERQEQQQQAMAAEQAKAVGSAVQSAGAGMKSLGEAGVNIAGEAPLLSNDTPVQ